MTDSILMQRDGDIATVVLNRPERLNALDKAMWMRLGASMRELAADDSVRCIADGAPLVARWHKKFIRRLADPRALSAEEAAESYACFDTEDFRTGYRAFLDKKKPRFTGR